MQHMISDKVKDKKQSKIVELYILFRQIIKTTQFFLSM